MNNEEKKAIEESIEEKFREVVNFKEKLTLEECYYILNDEHKYASDVKIFALLKIMSEIEKQQKEIEELKKDNINLNDQLQMTKNSVVIGNLDVVEDKKEEMYVIGKTNYTIGMLDERSQWYKKINEKIKEFKKENDELEEKKTFRITDKELIAEAKNNEAVTDLLNYKIRLAIIGQLEELIGKEE